MNRQCPSCGAALKDEDLDIQADAGKCSQCGATFKVTDLMGLQKDGDNQTPDADTSAKDEKESDSDDESDKKPEVDPAIEEADAGPITEPERMTTTESEDQLKIQWWWNRGQMGPGIVIVFIWDLFVVCGMVAAFQMAEWMLGIVLLPFAFFAVVFTYALMTSLVNQTQIIVSVDELKVWNGPLPTGGNQSILSASITRVDSHNDPAREQQGGRGSRTTTCRVSVTTMDGTRKDLVKGLRTYDEARYVASKIRTFLTL